MRKILDDDLWNSLSKLITDTQGIPIDPPNVSWMARFVVLELRELLSE